MKNEPWVRLGIFMSPKINEKPDDSRKRRPPSVMLFTASTNHRLMLGGPGRESRSALQRRIVTRVHGLREEPLLVVRPELAHFRIRLDRGVDELVALALGAADVEGPHDVAEAIEGEGTARRVGQGHRAERAGERLAVVGLAAGLLQRR